MPSRFALSLFWRTFVLLALLLGTGIFAWVQTFRALEFEPRAVQAAQQIASLVNLTRAALRYADTINRVTVIKTLSDQESLRLQPREPRDRYDPFEVDRFTHAIGNELRSRLGPSTIVASSVNNTPGLWIGFLIEGDQYRLHADRNRVQVLTGKTWFVWVGIALLATIIGSVAIAGLINRPLKQLSFAASRIREGDYDDELDETMMTREIREVNQGFNRMARELARIEEDRAVMLAGISHDLRTPLARLRLETEMSVVDEDAKRHMAGDIDQLDAIIDKFMDYARPGQVKLVAVHLPLLVHRTIAQFRDHSQIKFVARIPADTYVLADETELGRVLANLFENARRYGRTPSTDIAAVEINCVRDGPWVGLAVRDHGRGFPPEKLALLTVPFFRGDTARTAATGAGLGLAIVDKAIQRMGGRFELSNAPDGGLSALLWLRRTD